MKTSTERLRAGEAEHSFGSRIDESHDPVAVHTEDSPSDIVGDRLQQFFLSTQVGRGLESSCQHGFAAA